MKKAFLVVCILAAAGLAAEAQQYPPAIEYHSFMQLRFHEN